MAYETPQDVTIINLDGATRAQVGAVIRGTDYTEDLLCIPIGEDTIITGTPESLRAFFIQGRLAVEHFERDRVRDLAERNPQVTEQVREGRQAANDVLAGRQVPTVGSKGDFSR